MIVNGNGFDCHKILEKADQTSGFGKKCILGGIEIEDNLFFKAHSDGDVLVHSLVDSLAGVTLGVDIGELFPDTKKEYLDSSSILFLENVLQKIKLKHPGLIVNCIDFVIICDQIKILPIKKRIEENIKLIISKYFKVGIVSLKGKTTEKGFNDSYCYVYTIATLDI